MKVVYKGYGIHDSQCYVEIVKHGDHTFVIMTNGTGTSVTNACEQIATELFNTHNILRECAQLPIFIEHYDYDDNQGLDTSFTEVQFDITDDFKCSNPKWKPVGRDYQDVFKLL